MAQIMRVYLSETERANLEAYIQKRRSLRSYPHLSRIMLLADRSDGKWRCYGKCLVKWNY